MKKSLICLAVLAASGASFAQSNVTVYGVVDAFVGRTTGTGVSSKTSLDSGAISTNRFGFKGSEDLGGGLKANFLLEQGFSIDTGAAKGTSMAFDRQSYVGLSGGFGEVRFGKIWTAYDDISGATNAVFDSKLTPQNNVWMSVNYNANPANGAYYASPSVSGFSGAVSLSAGENNTAAAVQSAHVKYESGPAYVGVAFQRDEAFGAATEQKFTRVNGSYDLGVAKVLVGLGRVTATGGARTSEWGIGADYLVSPALTLSAGYARSKDNAAVGTGSEVRKGYGLGASYSLSKRTSVYGGYQSNTATVANVETDASLLAFGMRHAF